MEQKINYTIKPQTVEDILACFGKTIDSVKQIYSGKDHACRCGCCGKYFVRAEDSFNRALKRVTSLIKTNKVHIDQIVADPDDDGYVNIPDGTNDHCYTLYFRQ